MKTLNRTSRKDLPDSVAQLCSSPTATGIVHLGLGAFHRAHQAAYTQRAMQLAGGDWGICGVSLRRPDTRNLLNPQDNLYSLVVKNGSHRDVQLLSVLNEVLVAPENPAAVIDRLAAATVHVVTLTITEKGYCLDPVTGDLLWDNADIRHDLDHLEQPVTAIGYLAAGLRKRYQQQSTGLTIISCDNWLSNGDRLQRALLAFCQAVDVSFADWVSANVCCPCTMVDRIVPATTEADRYELMKLIGLQDRATVVTENFSQWFVEQRFAGPVPDWEQAGATYVDDVQPFEEMKLRLLNGSHSTMAYVACLSGIDTVAAAISRPEIHALVVHLMADEMAPGLDLPDGYDLANYQQQLLDRFANTGLQHLTRQIAMDGSQKIPQRLLPALRERLARGESVAALAFALATWVCYTRGIDEAGTAYSVQDPLADRLTVVHNEAGDIPQVYLKGILGLEEVFGKDGVATFYDLLLPPLQDIVGRGVLAAAADRWLR